MIFTDKIRVGVLRGGPSDEYEVSLATGKAVLDNLPPEVYEGVDIYIDKRGVWHERGMEWSSRQITDRLDVVWNALHGKYGEDGRVQSELEILGLPYTGSGPLGSAIGMNKYLSKKKYEEAGLKTPYFVLLNGNTMSMESIREAYNAVPTPFVVKPVSSGSSLGIRMVDSLPELEEAAVAALEYSPNVLVEEYIYGKEATCGVIDEYRGVEAYSLMPIEVRYGGGNVFDYNSKYVDDKTEIIIPGNFSREEKDMIEKMSVLAHNALGLRHYSRSDFRVHPRRGVYILETNTLPGLTDHSFIPKALSAAGSKLSDFLHHIISLALRGK